MNTQLMLFSKEQLLEEVLAPHIQALVLEIEDPPNEQLQGVLAPHVQALVLEIFPPGLPFLAMPG